MNNLLYATGNKIKFQQAQHACESFGVTLEQAGLSVPEIQGDDAAVIARDKAEKAFAKFGRPVAISDDSWVIPGLQGFPGAYMKYVNDWFTTENWLDLTRSLTDRRIILRQVIVYQDADQQKVFSHDIEGILLSEARGKSPYPHSEITSFDGGKHSNAEFHERGEAATNNQHNVWYDCAEWYAKHAK